MSMPSGWATVPVRYGEKRAHFYATSEDQELLGFHPTEERALAAARNECARNPDVMMAILKIEQVIKAKPVEVEAVHVNVEAS